MLRLLFSKALLLIPLAVLVSTCSFTVENKPAERFKFNLDLPPEDRWTSVLQNFNASVLRKELQSVISQMKSEAPLISDLFPTIFKIAEDLDKFIPMPFSGEMRGIAKDLEIDLGEIVLLNFLYDATAFCTSIVAENNANQIWHGRNLDFSFANVLRNITIELDAEKNGTTVFLTTSYIGYVGALTAMKPGAFSLSLDERNKGAWWENLLQAVKALVSDTTWPVSFLTRNVMETEKSFEGALKKLTYTPLIAPVYYILAGTNSSQGAVITRNRETALDVWKLEPSTNVWFLVETNYDHWEPPPKDDDRRDPAIMAMNKVGRDNISANNMFTVLSMPPVLNERTTYTTIMSASSGSYETYIRSN